MSGVIKFAEDMKDIFGGAVGFSSKYASRSRCAFMLSLLQNVQDNPALPELLLALSLRVPKREEAEELMKGG
jgi:hypothetical protein